MDDKLWQELVERIIASKSFGRSETYANLLRYLVEHTLSGDIPKDTTIGQHLFGSSAKENYDSAKVRVYIYNLRKKLEKYFEGEGSEEDYSLVIPKGGYKVELSKKISRNNDKLSKRPKPFAIIVFLIAVLTTTYFFLFHDKSTHSESFDLVSKSEIWSDIMGNEKPILIVIGDLIVYQEQNTQSGWSRTIRDPEINSIQQLETYKKSVPDTLSIINDLEYTLITRNSISWIETLTKLFFSQQRSFNTRGISNVQARDLHDHNIIFIGMQKTAGLFNNYFRSSQFSFPENDIYVYNDRKYSQSGKATSYHTDYGFVAKFPGPNNNTIFMFGGLWDTGVSQSLKNFTDSVFLKNIESEMRQKFDHIPDHFEVFFEVNGIDYTELNSKIIYLNEVVNTTDVWTDHAQTE